MYNQLNLWEARIDDYLVIEGSIIQLAVQEVVDWIPQAAFMSQTDGKTLLLFRSLHDVHMYLRRN